jgi:hypothetical protein
MTGKAKTTLLRQLERIPMDAERRQAVLAGAARWSEAETERYAGSLGAALDRFPGLVEELQSLRSEPAQTLC